MLMKETSLFDQADAALYSGPAAVSVQPDTAVSVKLKPVHNDHAEMLSWFGQPTAACQMHHLGGKIEHTTKIDPAAALDD